MVFHIETEKDYEFLLKSLIAGGELFIIYFIFLCLIILSYYYLIIIWLKLNIELKYLYFNRTLYLYIIIY